ncbi:MAG: glutamate racemase [Candidatus Melainabacteria bacterium]|nr:glutamate racemase [Candidatus Melainabacteria bacterium]
MNKPICLFDSGIGGLTVLKKLIDRFPNENYIYLADLARVPFGDKTKEEIKKIGSEILEWLLKFNPKLIIMACNTSSAVFGSQILALSSKLQIPIYGMIESCAKEIANLNHSKITVWATKLVTKSNAYKNIIQKHNPEIKTEEIACPKLVPMIEDLTFNLPDKESIIVEYLDMTSKDSEALVLGCTHYPLIKENLLRLTDLQIIDPTDSLLKDLENHLTGGKDISWNVPTTNKSQVSLYTTAQVEKLERFAKLYLCRDIKVTMVSLNKITV